MCKIIHRLNVYETEDGKHHHGGVFEGQETIGKIEGGGTCQYPLRIALTPAYAAAPQMIDALEKFKVWYASEWKSPIDFLAVTDALLSALAAAKAGVIAIGVEPKQVGI